MYILFRFLLRGDDCLKDHSFQVLSWSMGQHFPGERMSGVFQGNALLDLRVLLMGKAIFLPSERRSSSGPSTEIENLLLKYAKLRINLLVLIKNKIFQKI